MSKLPDFQTIEDAYQGVANVLNDLPPDNWRDRAKDHLELSKEAAYQNRDRVKPDRTETVPPVEAPAGLGFVMRGPVTTSGSWSHHVQITDFIISREESCTD